MSAEREGADPAGHSTTCGPLGSCLLPLKHHNPSLMGLAQFTAAFASCWAQISWLLTKHMSAFPGWIAGSTCRARTENQGTVCLNGLIQTCHASFVQCDAQLCHLSALGTQGGSGGNDVLLNPSFQNRAQSLGECSQNPSSCRPLSPACKYNVPCSPEADLVQVISSTHFMSALWVNSVRLLPSLLPQFFFLPETPSHCHLFLPAKISWHPLWVEGATLRSEKPKAWRLACLSLPSGLQRGNIYSFEIPTRGSSLLLPF